MRDDPRRPEVQRALLALAVTFGATVVLHVCVMSAYFAWGRSAAPFGIRGLERAVQFLPFFTMMYPGVRRLVSRMWLLGFSLLLAGWLLAFPALWIALMIIWNAFN